MSSAPSRAPDLVTAHNTSSTSLVVKWSHVPRQYFDGKPIGYNIHYVCRADKDIKIVSVSSATNTITLSNLHVYSMYYVAVAAVNSEGEGPATKIFVSTGEN